MTAQRPCSSPLRCALCGGEIDADDLEMASDGAAVHEEHEGAYEDIVYFREFEKE